jgi:hypothetical protein
MLEALSSSDTTSRWDALRSALMDPQSGVVNRFDDFARWGMVIYDGPLPGTDPMTLAGPADSCPRLVTVQPARDNFAVLDKAYTAQPLGGSTPTDRALATVVTHLPSQNEGPVIVVLATDGQPNDFCADWDGTSDLRTKVIEQVKAIATAGHKVFVISLAGEDAELSSHLEDVASAGATGKPPFVPQNKSELDDTLRKILEPQMACQLTLGGKVHADNACRGTVQLDGAPLACDNDDGWRLKDPETIELTGHACDAYKHSAQPSVSAEFPCDAVDLD